MWTDTHCHLDAPEFGANHALATQNGLFDAALSNMSQGLCMFDAKGRIVSCLEGGYNLSALGRSVEAHLRVLADV